MTTHIALVNLGVQLGEFVRKKVNENTDVILVVQFGYRYCK